jgi:hypothetical protein
MINLIFKDKEIEVLKFPEPSTHYYIEVKPGMIYETSKMETLLIDFDRKASKYKAMGA